MSCFMVGGSYALLGHFNKGDLVSNVGSCFSSQGGVQRQGQGSGSKTVLSLGPLY